MNHSVALGSISRIHVWECIQEALLLESKYQPALRLPTSIQGGSVNEVTMSMRDGSAQVLRCLKVWYELPSQVLVDSLNITDRFLSRMRTRPKHLSCIAISAFLLSVRYAAGSSSCGDMSTAPSAADLVTISQAKCTAGDVSRMCAIIGDKLGCDANVPSTRPLTAASWLQLFSQLVTAECGGPGLPLDWLLPRLESLLCNGRVANIRSCELALAVVAALPTPADAKLAALLEHVRQFCRIEASAFAKCQQLVIQLLASYEAAVKVPRRLRQRLLWKLSNRTLRQLRPTTQILTVLPTIEESCLSSSNAVKEGASVSIRCRRLPRARSAVRCFRNVSANIVDNRSYLSSQRQLVCAKKPAVAEHR